MPTGGMLEMTIKQFYAVLFLVSLTPISGVAAAVGPTPLGGEQLGIVGLPLETGGMMAIAAVSLIIGAQLIKRKK